MQTSDHPDWMRTDLGKRIESFHESFLEWVGLLLFGLFLIAIGGLFVWLSTHFFSPDVWNDKGSDPVTVWGARILAPVVALFTTGLGIALIYCWFFSGDDRLDLFEQGAVASLDGKLAVVQWSDVHAVIETEMRHGLRPNVLSVAVKVMDRPVFRYVAQLANGGEYTFGPCSEAQTPRLKQLLRHYADHFQWTWTTVVEYQ